MKTTEVKKKRKEMPWVVKGGCFARFNRESNFEK